MASAVHRLLIRLLGVIGCLMLSAWSGPCLATAAPLMHAMFQDHAVLQRDRPIPVWGQAKPGVAVTVTFAGHTAQGTADAKGSWSATLPAMPAGGPYTLTARAADGESETAQDVLVGDVWLCTGQSNMVLWVWAAGEALFTERQATDSSMRMMTIADTASLTPLEDFATPVSWVVESPKTVGQFSASCYYFARALKEQIHVPMGMVVAAWGGSLVQDWIGEGTIARSHLYDRDLRVRGAYARDHQAGYEAWGRMWQDWWNAHAPKSMGKPWQPSYDDSAWPVAPDLTPWGNWQDPKVAAFLGDMWYRTTVDLTAAQAAQAAKLSVGKANEEDLAWVNGRPVGSIETGPALHDIPPGTLHAGTNTIVFNLFCSWKRCGLTAPADQRLLLLADGGKVPLTAPWRYQPVPNGIGMAPREPWGELGGISMAYNGLIAPIGPYAFRGAIWYQGESNIYWTGPYEELLTDLMADWRRTYGADLPFLVVQIPNYGAIPTQPAASGWSEVREAQRRAVAKDRHAALAVTIDIGNATNLHPSDKIDVGVRLARAASHLIYGENVYPSGPEPAGAFRRGASVVVPFKDVTGKLVSYSGYPNAFELCGATLATCRYVRASIQGDDVILTDVDGKSAPTRVRFCWGDSPICTLYDESGLPAGPFELPIGPAQAQAREPALGTSEGTLAATIKEQKRTLNASMKEESRELRVLGIRALRQPKNPLDPHNPNFANYDEAKANRYPNLPALMTLNDGTKVTTPAQWRERRAEIRAFFDENVYGKYPTDIPGVSWKVASVHEQTVYGIPAIVKHVVGHVDNSRDPAITVDIPVDVVTPAATRGKGVPVIVGGGVPEPFVAGGITGDNGPYMHVPGMSECTAVGPRVEPGAKLLLERGWGYAAVNYNAVQADNGAGLDRGIIGLTNRGKPRRMDTWGVARAWAWTSSRTVDYLDTDPDVDPHKIGVEGHSRYGKAALVALVDDPRIAVGYISASGKGGAALYRRNYGESVASLAAPTEFEWFAGNLLRYAAVGYSVNQMPMDSHELIALVAPRAIFISGGSLITHPACAVPGDAWEDARGMFMAEAAASPAWELLGKRGLGTDTPFPPVNTLVGSGSMGFRQHPYGHTPATNWRYFIEFAAPVFAGKK